MMPSVLDIPTPGPAILKPPAPAPSFPTSVGEFRQFGDTKATRKLIFDNVLERASAIEPVTNPRYSLSISDVAYHGPADYSIADQKQALLTRQTLSRALKGTYTLRDAEGNELSKRRMTLAKIPYMTQRGTFIVNGTEYTMAHQMRLRPGVFTRQMDNGELESHVNVSKGFSHRIFLDPKTGIFRIKMGQARIPLLPLLRAQGVSDKQLRDVWGNELTAINIAKDDPQTIGKLYNKLYPRGEDSALDRRQRVVEAFEAMELDPEVTKRTLGADHHRVGPDTLLAITKKLIDVSRGNAEPDDRDALAFQKMIGPEDLFAERLEKAKDVTRRLLWKASVKGNLDRLTTGAFNDAVMAGLMSSGLGMPLEEINPADIFDQQVRVTRMGEGGIPSLDAVPDEARAVQPSQFGFVDFLRTPESGKVGVDARMARGAVKGRDGRIYTAVTNVRTGRQEYKSPQDMADLTVAFPGAMNSSDALVPALASGKFRMVPRNEVDDSIPQMEDTFSPLGNMIPMKSMVKGQRAVMAARMLTQALPLINAEAPLVQSGIPGQDGRSFEEEYAKHMGALRADGPGRVISNDAEGITVVDQQGKEKTYPLYNNFPFNRKTFFHQTATVQPGDVVEADQLLARSNFTDGQGVTALGLNARVAYVPWEGLNFEDATVVSQSFAARASSEHMYQHGYEWDGKDHRGKKEFVSLYPAKFDRRTLDNFTDNGVIKPGTEVKYGDPLVLVARERERNRKSLLRSHAPSYTDETLTWEHHVPGIVTDVVDEGKGTAVVVKAVSPLEVGDKLSGRFGDKGIVSRIVPDDEMPASKDGIPYEILLNPLGVISRTNPAQIVEAALGKIAAARGEPFKIQDFQDQEDFIEYALEELRKAGMSDTESIVDPRNDRSIHDIFTGNRWFMKLHHTSESKNQGRGLGR